MSDPHVQHSSHDSASRPEGLERIDVEAATSAARHRHHPVVKTLGSLSEVADQIPLGVVCGTVMVGGIAAGRPDLLRLGARMMAAHVVANLAKRQIKNRVRRIRPEEVVKNRNYRFEAGETQGGHDTSFPSGHTAGAVAVATIVSHDRPAWTMPAMGLAALIAGVQIPRAKHYPIDVAAGTILGLASAWLVNRLLPDGNSPLHHAQETSMSDNATQSITAVFDTREAADRAIEHLVQQHGLDRSDIFAEADGADNTAGTRPSGGDADQDHASANPALKGGVRVSADVANDHAGIVRNTLRDMGGRDISGH